MKDTVYKCVIVLLVFLVILQSFVIWTMTSNDDSSRSYSLHDPAQANISTDLAHRNYSNGADHKSLPFVQCKNFAAKTAVSGVAVTMFLGSPKWYQNRYSMMVNQMVAILPDDWVVQIYYNPQSKMAMEGIQYPGIQNQVQKKRVVLTAIPAQYQERNKIKKNEFSLKPYIWENIAYSAENVLLFGGNSVLCANSERNITAFTESFDHIGSPWNVHRGKGGANGLSLRKRSLMLAVLYELHNASSGVATDSGDVERRYAEKLRRSLRQQQQRTALGNVSSASQGLSTAVAHKSLKGLREDSFVVGKLLSHKDRRTPAVRVADRQDTHTFAMWGNIAEGGPLGAVGTLDGLTDSERQKRIDYCPEMKMMFPSLHSPSCFGADPNALECFRYLCVDGGLKCHRKDHTLSFRVKNTVVTEYSDGPKAGHMVMFVLNNTSPSATATVLHCGNNQPRSVASTILCNMTTY